MYGVQPVAARAIVFSYFAFVQVAIAQGLPTTYPANPRPQPNRVAFVCDASDTMVAKMPVLKRELSNTVEGLRVFQSFNVIFMRADGCAALDDNRLLASPDNKKKAIQFIEDFKPGGQTNPLPAIQAAFKSKPLALYLVGDRHFPNDASTLKLISALNSDHKTRIYTIAFLQKEDEEPELVKLFQRIASENDGDFKLVTLSSSDK